MIDLLCKEPGFQTPSRNMKTMWSLKKRLQRGRKYVLLVSMFGEKILQAAPEVSVTRLDVLKLEDLSRLASERSGSLVVQNIISKLGQSSANTERL